MQNSEPLVDKLDVAGINAPQDQASVAQSKNSLETILQELRSEFARNSFAERQLRARAAQRAAKARAEASSALARAADADARREQAERELAELADRSLRLESTLREAVATLNSLQKTDLFLTRQRFRDWRHAKLIRNSPLFNAGWYVQRYPEVVTSRLDPAYEFLWNAALLGRNPSPGFDSSWYLLQHSDVAQTGMNPLLHYILFGAAEGREIRPAEAQPTGRPRK